MKIENGRSMVRFGAIAMALCLGWSGETRANVTNDLYYAGNEDTTQILNVLDNDANVGTIASLIATNITPVASITIGAGATNVVYTPNANWNGTNWFWYVTAGGTQDGTGMVRVVVRPVNDLPIANPDSYIVPPGVETLLYPLSNDYDIDGDTVRIEGILSGPTNGVVRNLRSSVTYAASTNLGPDSFTYYIRDGMGGFATSTVSVATAIINQSPIAMPDSAVTVVGASANVFVLLNDKDPEDDPLSIIFVTAPSNGGSAIISGNAIVYTPVATGPSTDSFTYWITDGNGNFAYADVNVLIRNDVAPLPDWITLVFPSLVPKAGHGSKEPAGLESGTIRDAYATRFENYWKDVSYYRFDPTTGNKIRGFSQDTKTYGYVYMPWALAPVYNPDQDPLPTSYGEAFQDGARLYEAPQDPPYTDGCDSDGVWTPGESLRDNLVQDSRWTDAEPAEDYWNSDNTPVYLKTRNGAGVAGADLRSFSYGAVTNNGRLQRPNGFNGNAWSATGGELYADYDGSQDWTDSVRIFYAVEVAVGSNEQFMVMINELDLSPTNSASINEGDFYHTAVPSPTLPPDPTVVNIPRNGVFDYTANANGTARVVPAVNNVGDTVYVAYRAYIRAGATAGAGGFYGPEDAWVGIGQPATNEVASLTPQIIRVPVYQAEELFGVETIGTNVRGDDAANARTVAVDNTWTAATVAEAFEDFISIGGAWLGEKSDGSLANPATDNPRGRGRAMTWDEYEMYIRWNYPGDADALLARAYNGRYDGPEAWTDAPGMMKAVPGFPADYPGIPFYVYEPVSIAQDPEAANWDDRWFATWQDWYVATFGAEPNDWDGYNGYFTELTDADINSGPSATRWIPADAWKYNSNQEFADLPSSLYHIGGDPANATAYYGGTGIYGGDGILGEVTSPWSDARYGQDIHPPSSTGAVPSGPDNMIAPAGPFCYNTIGGNGYDGANVVVMEFMTRKTRPTSGVITETHPQQLRDTNLDGLIDLARPRLGDPHYSTNDAGEAGEDGSGDLTFYPFTRNRYMEDIIAIWDQMEDFSVLEKAHAAGGGLYGYPIYPPSTDPGYAALGGPAGANIIVLTRDQLDPIKIVFQVRPVDGNGETGGLPDVGIEDFGMSLLAHEQGHDIFGYPDLYDYDTWQNTNPQPFMNQPIAGYDLMAGGGLVHGVADLKDAAGWLLKFPSLNTLVPLPTLSNQVTRVTLDMYPVESYPDQYLRFYNENGNNLAEYFDIWYTDNTFPNPYSDFRIVGGRGVYICHVDKYGNKNALPRQQRVNNHFVWEMVQADGLDELADGVNRGNAGDPFPGDTTNKTWSADSNPPARWWDAKDIGLRIVNIVLPPLASGLPAKVTFERYQASAVGWVYSTENAADIDGDGIADFWELHYFGNLTTANGTTDYDFDGLRDLAEYRAHTNPANMTPPAPMTGDAVADPDQDGLSNLEEDQRGTDPMAFDTDDDGIGDGDEVRYFAALASKDGFLFTNPLFSRSPTVQRSIYLGAGFLLPSSITNSVLDDRFMSAQTNFTVEMWVKFPDLQQTGSLIVHTNTFTGRVGYELRVDNNIPMVRFQTHGGEWVTNSLPTAGVIPSNTWTHLAATWNETNDTLNLYVNGETFASRMSLLSPDVGAGPTWLGRGLATNTLVDEVRIWTNALTATEIATNSMRIINEPWNTNLVSNLAGNYRFDDGGTFAEDFVRTNDVRYGLGLDAGGRPPVFSTDAPLLLGEDDGDNDGLPDWWVALHGVTDGTLDPDGDGLSNYFEFLAGTNPKSADSDADGMLDGNEDMDGDGLTNEMEQDIGSHPRLTDTDDDGIPDEVELAMGADADDSRSPASDRRLSLPGSATAYLLAPHDQRFSLKSYTLAAWIRPTASNGTIIERTVATIGADTFYNYKLEMVTDAGKNKLRASFSPTFNSADLVTLDSPDTAQVPLNDWSHVAETFDPATGELALYLNGSKIASKLTTKRPMSSGVGPINTRVGPGFTGLIDEVGIFGSVQSADVVAKMMGGLDLLASSSMIAYWPFDDGTSAGAGPDGLWNTTDDVVGTSAFALWKRGQVEDYALAPRTDWLNKWWNAATLVGAVQVAPFGVSDGEPPVSVAERDTDGDGLPDWWETENGLNPNDATGVNGASGDFDNDGLTNETEYRTGTDPRQIDTDGDGVLDGLEDSDGDLLTNAFEQNTSGTDPGLKDTDDDGLTDYAELFPGPGLRPSNPLNAMDPIKRMSAEFTGAPLDRLVIPENKQHKLQAWSIEAWVRPALVGSWPGTRGVVARRAVYNNQYGSGIIEGVNYELGLKIDSGNRLRPYVLYSGIQPNGTLKTITVDGFYEDVNGNGVLDAGEDYDGDGQLDQEVLFGQQATSVIPEEEWSHLLATYDPSLHTLSLYINGDLVAYRQDAFSPTGIGLFDAGDFEGETTIGGGSIAGGAVQNRFVGYIDDVAILAGAMDADAARDAADAVKPLEQALTSAVASKNVTQLDLANINATNYVAGQVVVRFKDDVAPQAATTKIAGWNLQKTRSFSKVPVQVLKINDGKTVAEKIAELRKDPSVLYAEPNMKRWFNRMPNDPNFSQLWGMNNTGQTGGKTDADIDAPEAWERSIGSRDVIVAVIDSGMEVTHPDLKDNVWINPGEVAGDGIDNDGNGLIDDVNGYDFANGDGNPDDTLGHGTHVSGTIGAVGNNGIGVCGVNWRVKMMALKVGDYFLSEDAILAAIDYAIQHGAKVMNASYGGYYFSQAEYDAIAAANAAGVLMCAAAGNDTNDNDTMPSYPASYDLPNIIAVAATDANDQIAYFSSYGVKSVDLAAPGVSVYSTYPGGYETMDGTSMATPHVTGAAALVASVYPSMGHLAWKQMILGSVDPIASLNGMVATGGRLNVKRAAGGAGVPVAYFTFNDGGVTAQDELWPHDWTNGWKHAAVWSGNAGAKAVQFVASYQDSDADGLPDWWETAVGLDPFDSTGDQGAAGDPDGDGLTNLTEYQSRIDLDGDGIPDWWLNPFLADTDQDGVKDGIEDDDGDGLSNAMEQQYGTDAGRADTDDDGVADGAEIAGRTDPLDPYSPDVQRAVLLNGEGRLRARDESTGDVTQDWTIEAWVRPELDGQNAVLIRRAERYGQGTDSAGNDLRWIDYELGLTNGVPYVRYVFRDNAGTIAKPINPVAIQVKTFAGEDTDHDGAIDAGEQTYVLPIARWSHVAAVRDSANSELRLFVNGKEYGRAHPARTPPVALVGTFETVMGGGDLVRNTSGVITSVTSGFNGLMDAVRIWAYVRTGVDIQDARGVLLPEFFNGQPDPNRAPVRLFNFDDGGTTFENSSYLADWKVDWAHAAVVEQEGMNADADVTTVLAGFAPIELDSDDDTFGDQYELVQNTLELRAESPFVRRYLSFQGGQVLVDERVDGTQTDLYGLTNWTVEAWARPRVIPSNGQRIPLVTRRTVDGDWATFEIGLVGQAGGAKAYVRFNRADASHSEMMLVGGPVVVPTMVGATGQWTHVAAVFDSTNHLFALYLNGVESIRSTDTSVLPIWNTPGELKFGWPTDDATYDAYTGDLKEIRIWSVPRTVAEIRAKYMSTLLFSTSLLENSYQGGGSYLGRATATNEAAYQYDYTTELDYGMFTIPYGLITHAFAVEAWVKLEAGSGGGLVAQRKVDNGINQVAWMINHSLRVNANGNPEGYMDGVVRVYTPVYNQQGNLTGLNAADEDMPRTITSEVDIRDGNWHHLAFVGDSVQLGLYIDGKLDTSSGAYYTLVDRAGPPFEGTYRQPSTLGSVLRIAGDDGENIDGIVDEVMFWNVGLREDEVRKHMWYGLTKTDIRKGLATIAPTPTYAIDDGLSHHSLVSYVTVDGKYVAPYVYDQVTGRDPYRVLPIPTGREIVSDIAPPIFVDRMRAFDKDLVGYFPADDGGEHTENFAFRNDYGYAGRLIGDATFTDFGESELSPLGEDSDGDTLPDWWESMNGLDPTSPDGANGSSGDPDRDGLSNRAEFLADTDPFDYDTDGDGINDYDDNAGPGTRSWGELFTDGDGMPDAWESLYAPYLSPLVYDAEEDPDGDGWTNYQEYLGGTDPLQNRSFPQPAQNLQFFVRYDGIHTNGILRAFAYTNSTMDGVGVTLLDLSKVVDVATTNVHVKAVQDLYVETGALPAVPVVPDSVHMHVDNPLIDIYDDGAGNLLWGGVDVGDIDYATGQWNIDTTPTAIPLGTLIYIYYTYRQTTVTYPAFAVPTVTSGHMLPGANWFFVWIDNNQNQTWDDDEPAGLPMNPVGIGPGGMTTVDVGLTDKAPPGYIRFSWVEVATNVSHTVSIRNVMAASGPNGPIVAGPFTVTYRNFVHEGDLIYRGIYGLDPMNSYATPFEWFVQHGQPYYELVESDYSDVLTWPKLANFARPTVVAPNGRTLAYAQNEFSWRMDTNSTLFRIRIRNGSGTVVFDKTSPRPYADSTGLVRYTPPIYAGDTALPDGNYTWEVAGWYAYGWSAWSATGSFAVNMQAAPAGAYTISGRVEYFGRAKTLLNMPVGGAPVIVQAYRSYGFGGSPSSQVTLDGKGAYSIMGLRAGNYFVRAFMDVNRNGRLDGWEPMGFVRNTAGLNETEYAPLMLVTPGNVLDAKLVMRDRDTNNNGVSDAWEIQFLGQLRGDVATRDSDGDGLTDLQEYAMEWGDTDPNSADTDGDGLSDYQEVWYDGDGAYEVGRDTDPLNPDTDGDTVLDGADTDPLNLGVADTDGDGFPDAFEDLFGAGYKFNAALVPPVNGLAVVRQLLPLSTGGLRAYMSFDQGISSVQYDVNLWLEWAPSLSGPYTKVPGSDHLVLKFTNPGVWSADDPAGTTSGFYRVGGERRSY